MSELEKVTAVTTEYDASEIQVLEGLEAVRNVWARPSKALATSAKKPVCLKPSIIVISENKSAKVR